MVRFPAYETSVSESVTKKDRSSSASQSPRWFVMSTKRWPSSCHSEKASLKASVLLKVMETLTLPLHSTDATSWTCSSATALSTISRPTDTLLALSAVSHARSMFFCGARLRPSAALTLCLCETGARWSFFRTFASRDSILPFKGKRRLSSTSWWGVVGTA